MTFNTSERAGWLAQTKLIPPALSSDVLARPRLAQALQQALSPGKVLLVSAPAGYGKTTLLSTFPLMLPDLPGALLLKKAAYSLWRVNSRGGYSIPIFSIL
jgi:predicted ATPase with chaperone activity